MTRKTILTAVLSLSLLANAGIAAASLYMLHSKGGISYVRQKMNATDPFRVQRESLFAVLDRKAQQPIVFLGDSLTANCEWSELLNVPVLNRGISGETTTGLLSRLDRVTALHPRAVFLMVGVNDNKDLHYPIARTVSNYRAILERLKRESPETTIYVQSVLPVRERGEQFNAWSKDVNRNLQKMCDGHQVICLDFYSRFLQGDELNPALSVDGIHLNGLGYELWRDLLAPSLHARQQ